MIDDFILICYYLRNDLGYASKKTERKPIYKYVA